MSSVPTESFGDLFDRRLRFGRENREWKLMIDAGFASDGSGETWTSVPALNSSREIRFEIVDHLPALVQALVERAATEVAVVRTKADEVAKLATVVRGSRGATK